MTTPDELARSFWEHLSSDRIVMLSTDGAPPRPMAAQFEELPGPLHFFAGTDSDLIQASDPNGTPRGAAFTFQAKGMEFWASISGMLAQTDDPATIDRLWNPMVAAWFPEGRDDPTLRLLRFDAHEGELWGDASNLAVMVKAAFGRDVTADYQDKTAHVRL